MLMTRRNDVSLGNRADDVIVRGGPVTPPVLPVPPVLPLAVFPVRVEPVRPVALEPVAEPVAALDALAVPVALDALAVPVPPEPDAPEPVPPEPDAPPEPPEPVGPLPPEAGVTVGTTLAYAPTDAPLQYAGGEGCAGHTVGAALASMQRKK